MRLWTLHPKYLDPQGLVAAWREALLAQKVLMGETKGYCNHPQLIRFQKTPKPVHAMGAFLKELEKEARERSYNFDKKKIIYPQSCSPISTTQGQLLYEWQHLLEKLRQRSPEVYARHCHIQIPEPHPLFCIVPGPVEPWEKQR
ncbi:MAG: pyrimidine dimer DNA glycosylase/endonuclease V [Puniceicoccales bacterium]|jgi:hypothetical protein|nr:pyrimidine dimer DNA glycosylase/endonuclease V [Puniceicoccales bacterium]